jgi:hypothetical protein
VEQVAQIGQGLRFCRIRPKEERQVLAGLGSISVEDEVGEERLQSRRIDGCQQLIAIAQPEIAKQLNAQFGH